MTTNWCIRPSALGSAALLLAGVLAGAANAQTTPATPSAMLKWSMGRYAGLATFQADCSVRVTTAPAGATTSARTIQLSKPNLFRVTSNTVGATQTSVCDGKKLVEFMTGAAVPAQSSPAPASITEAHSVFLSNPMMEGSLLYQFFGGAGRYVSLVNETKVAPAFGAPVTLDGQPCKTVKFWSQGTYGSTEVAIGETDGLVHRILYRNEPLIEQMAKMMKSPEFIAQFKKLGQNLDLKTLAQNIPTSMESVETYANIKCGEPISPETFTANPPAGQEVQEQAGAPAPPVPLGKPAPEIAVKSVDGSPKTLAALRGRVVLIDFWATWCPPCRKGLPETQALYNTYAKKGLAVLTISDETKATVTPYLKSNKLTFPAFLDQAGATNKAWHIQAIPTVAIIDKAGNLSSFFVGLQDKSVILAALKKAGLAAD